MNNRIWIWGAVFAAAAAAILGHSIVPGPAGAMVAVFASGALVLLFVFGVFGSDRSNAPDRSETGSGDRR